MPMVNAKKANALIWVGNILLIVGIVAFALQFLIMPEIRTRDFDPPISIPVKKEMQDETDVKALTTLLNPLVPGVKDPGDRVKVGPVKLQGTDQITGDPTSHVAYLSLPARQLNVNAYVNEAVKDDSTGVEVPELAGWRLKSVTPKTATFTVNGEERTLQLEEIVAAAPTGPPGPFQGGGLQAGIPWDASKFTTKKDPARSNDSQEAWNIDRKEVEWAAANVDSILSQVSLEVYAGGGLKINSVPENTFVSDRGLRSGDVLRSVNGQQVMSIQQLGDVMRSLSKNATTLSIMVDRSGRMYTLTYTVPRPGR